MEKDPDCQIREHLRDVPPGKIPDDTPFPIRGRLLQNLCGYCSPGRHTPQNRNIYALSRD